MGKKNVFLDILSDERTHVQPVTLTLLPINANLYARRYSARNCEHIARIPPPIQSPRPPAVPKRSYVPLTTAASNTQVKPNYRSQFPSPTPTPRNRGIPSPPPPRSPASLLTNINTNSNSPKQKQDSNRNASPKQAGRTTNDYVFQFDNSLMHEFGRIPPAPVGPPPPAPKNFHKPSASPGVKTAPIQQHNNSKNSVRQDSNVSSDSFSQTSSPSYTTKTMETPLLPPRTPNKPNAVLNSAQPTVDDGNGNSALTKGASTPASLQTIVRFHSGSNMSLHHRIIRDMRSSSSHHYVRSVRLKFRFAQVVMNAIALIAIGGGLAAYFKAHPAAVDIVNATVDASNSSSIPESAASNPAPGICLPVIVGYCQQHKVPYNYTVFPNYMGHFGQPDAQHELEVYDAVVDVRCYELAALFLCTVFVPKCGTGGIVVRPCRSLCLEMKRRCGFFLDVFALPLPEYLECNLFPESPDPEVCVGHHEVKEAKVRAQKPGKIVIILYG